MNLDENELIIEEEKEETVHDVEEGLELIKSKVLEMEDTKDLLDLNQKITELAEYTKLGNFIKGGYKIAELKILSKKVAQEKVLAKAAGTIKAQKKFFEMVDEVKSESFDDDNEIDYI